MEWWPDWLDKVLAVIGALSAVGGGLRWAWGRVSRRGTPDGATAPDTQPQDPPPRTTSRARRRRGAASHLLPRFLCVSGGLLLFAAVLSVLSRSASHKAQGAGEAAERHQPLSRPAEEASKTEPPPASLDSVALREMLRAGEEEFRREGVESARRMFERVVEVAPHSEEARQAERWLQRVNSLKADLDDYAVAEGYYYAGRHAQARIYLERIVARGEDDRPVVRRAQDLLHKIREEGPAREEAERWLTMGKNYFSNGNRARAREYFEKVMNALPGSDLAAEANSWLDKCR